MKKVGLLVGLIIALGLGVSNGQVMVPDTPICPCIVRTNLDGKIPGPFPETIREEYVIIGDIGEKTIEATTFVDGQAQTENVPHTVFTESRRRIGRYQQWIEEAEAKGEKVYLGVINNYRFGEYRAFQAHRMFPLRGDPDAVLGFRVLDNPGFTGYVQLTLYVDPLYQPDAGAWRRMGSLVPVGEMRVEPDGMWHALPWRMEPGTYYSLAVDCKNYVDKSATSRREMKFSYSFGEFRVIKMKSE